MIQENFQDIQIKYLYIGRFTWYHPAIREEFQNHPHQGRVYRAIFNPLTKNYKMLIPGADGLGFEGLVASNEAHDYEMFEINLDTILDHDIQEQDLDQMNKWLSDNNADIQRDYYQPTDQGLHKLKEALHNQGRDEAEALAIGTEVLMQLWHTNPDKYEVVVNLMQFLTDADLDSYADPGHYVRLHPVSGKGVNIVQALRAIDKYNCDDRRFNEDLADLYVAIEALIVEAERKISNGLID